MLPRQSIISALFLFAAGSAQAQTMTAEQAKEFVSGALFSYRCFDGTVGSGRIFTDGAAAGSIRVMGRGNTRYLQLPPNTLYVAGSQVCANLKGLPFQPCFNVVKTGPETFRGSVSHMSFMYCDFRRGSVLQLARRRGATEKLEKAEKADKPAEKTPKIEKAEKAEKPAEKKPAEASSGGEMQLRR
jgi:hypothetical protein